MGIIFTNVATMGELTNKRSMASIRVGGRYRQVDFALSNLSCAGVRHVGIISRHNYQSLMNHIGDGEEWGLELEEGGLEFLTPYAQTTVGTYRGKLESLNNAMDFLEYGDEDELVVMIDSAVLSNIDLTAVLNAHVASGKDVTVVTKAGVCNGEKKIDLALKVEDGEIKDMVVDYVADKDYVASMDIFVLSKKFLVKAVKALIARDKFHMDRDLVMGGWNRGIVSVNTYAFEGTAMFNESVEEYFQNTMALIKKDVRADIFGGAHPVYTKVRDRVPTYYGEGSEIENCLVADGCMVEGEVEDSVLFREVSIGKGAEVEHCIIFNDAVIGEGAELKYVILDKNVTVTPGAKLIGTKKNPIIVKRGETV
ncbi:MAG: glucose-1-phosphate adenylyltransferase subunit GlgD, partial [Oscillospiraceae bacterium]|nr:glucose-1-phosphate adenylyltransferase subunit GlgD [Oscillospiraceae bacterium]